MLGPIKASGFFYPDPTITHQLRPLTLSSVSAHTTIIASTSRTTLTQTYTNPSKQDVPELRYTFPLYDGVSVVGFTCTINRDRIIRGVVKERDQARHEYEAARDSGVASALFEGLREAGDVFTTSVANVPAGAEIKVELVYLGELKHDAEVDGIRFVIPTAIAPRYGDYPHGLVGGMNVASKGGKIDIVVDVEMPPNQNIKSLQSPSHPIGVSLGNTSAGVAAGTDASLAKASATLSLGTAELDKDFILQVVAANTGDPVAVLETHPTIPHQRALMTTLVPRFNLPSIRPEIVFVCDRSGSMSYGEKIPNLKSALHVFLKSLPLGVKFNICSFGTHYKFLFEDGSRSYSADSLNEAMRHVDTFAANFGGTEMYSPVEEAIKKRYKDMPLQIFLLTDGEIWDQDRLFAMVRKYVDESKGEIRVFTLGIGSNVSHSLIEGVARAGNGVSQAVGDNEQMSTKVVRMLKASLTPVVKDYTLEIKYGGNTDGDADDDFEIVEKVIDALTLNVVEPATSEQSQKPTETPAKKPISLHDPTIDPDVEMTDSGADTTAGGKYVAVPAVPEPKLLQTPADIPPLYAFNRTTAYVLLSPEASRAPPRSVVLRGTSVHGPLELEIPVVVLERPGETIHQLAARAAMRELEDGRGWIYQARDATSAADGAAPPLLKDRYPGRFQDMVERAAVTLGVRFGVAGSRWCSFVAVDEQQKQSRDKAATSTERRTSVIPSPSIPQTLGVAQTFAAAQTFGAQLPSCRHSPAFAAAAPTARASPAMARSISPMGPGAMPPPPPAPMTRQMMKMAAVPAATRSLQPVGAQPEFAKRSKAATGGLFSSSQLSRAASASERGGDMASGFAHFNDAPNPKSKPVPVFDDIVARQSFEGFWTWDVQLLQRMGIDADRLLEKTRAVLGGTLGEASPRLATAVVLAYLEVEMAGRKGEWEMLAEKAADWIEANVVDGGKMTAEAYVASVRGVLVGLKSG